MVGNRTLALLLAGLAARASACSVRYVSATTGDGMEEFIEAVGEAAKEYERDYLPELQRRRAANAARADAAKAGANAGAVLGSMVVNG